MIARRLHQREDGEGAPDERLPQIGVTDRTQAALWAQRHGLGLTPLVRVLGPMSDCSCSAWASPPCRFPS